MSYAIKSTSNNKCLRFMTKLKLCEEGKNLRKMIMKNNYHNFFKTNSCNFGLRF